MNDFGSEESWTLEWRKKMLLTISASNRCFQPWSINHCSHSWWCSLREVQDGKHRVSAQVMKMCSEWKSLSPHACIFPYIEKSKIINLGTLFLVIHSSLLMFNYIFFFPSKNSRVFWLLPYFIGTVLQSYLRGYLLGLSPQEGPRTKYNLQALSCTVFSSWHVWAWFSYAVFLGKLPFPCFCFILIVVLL